MATNNIYLSTQTAGHQAMIGYSVFGVEVETFSFNIATTVSAAGFANNDVLVLAQIPLNSSLLGFYISSPALDSSTGITTEIGDTSSLARYVASTSTMGQGAVDVWHNAINAFVAGSLPRAYTTQTTYSAQSLASGVGANSVSINLPATSQNIADFLILKVTHAATTPVTSGTLKGFVLYTLNTAS